MFRFVSARFVKITVACAALGAVVLGANAFAGSPPKAAGPVAAAAASPGISGGSKELAGIAPQDLKAGNAPIGEMKKKRGESATVAPSKEAIVTWFAALNIKHTVDDQGRVIVPFRDEATGINFNILLIPRVKAATGAVWAIQGVVPLALPLPAGDSGLARALIFSNNWNNDHFLNKASLMQPGEKPFFLLDATIVCEGGLNQADFFNNFLVLLVQDGLGFAKKGLAELR